MIKLVECALLQLIPALVAVSNAFHYSKVHVLLRLVLVYVPAWRQQSRFEVRGANQSIEQGFDQSSYEHVPSTPHNKATH